MARGCEYVKDINLIKVNPKIVDITTNKTQSCTIQIRLYSLSYSDRIFEMIYISATFVGTHLIYQNVCGREDYIIYYRSQNRHKTIFLFLALTLYLDSGL